MKCPPISQELIDYLDRLFPDRVPDLNQNPARALGNVDVVRHLKLQHEQQENVTYVSSEAQDFNTDHDGS